MRARTSRRNWGVLGPLLFAAVFVVECGDSTAGATDGNGTNATNATGGPSATVHVPPEVTFGCTNGSCTVQATLVNDGPDCAVAVQGVTHLLDGAGNELGSVSWTFGSRLRPGHDETISGCCVTPGIAQATRSSRTDVTSRAILCI